jgi:hypothetical protein
MGIITQIPPVKWVIGAIVIFPKVILDKKGNFFSMKLCSDKGASP